MHSLLPEELIVLKSYSEKLILDLLLCKSVDYSIVVMRDLHKYQYCIQYSTALFYSQRIPLHTFDITN